MAWIRKPFKRSKWQRATGFLTRQRITENADFLVQFANGVRRCEEDAQRWYENMVEADYERKCGMSYSEDSFGDMSYSEDSSDDTNENQDNEFAVAA
eukprot:COSAG05_NODE_805_length_7205_cov_12.164650_4_plen_97_part_00